VRALTPRRDVRFGSRSVGYSSLRPVVKRLTELIQLRNTHSAFDGNLHVEHTNAHAIHLHWRHRETSCSLRVDLATGVLNIYD
jgi:hypothetical protein